MLKFTDGFDVDPLKKEVKGDIFADSKADLTGDVAAKLNLPEGMTLAWGISAMTADGEIAFLKSDGTWNWVG